MTRMRKGTVRIARRLRREATIGPPARSARRRNHRAVRCRFGVAEIGILQRQDRHGRGFQKARVGLFDG